MRFAKNTQHDTSKVLRLPRKMAMDTSKVLRLPRKLQHIFWKRRKSIAPATQNDFRHVPEHVWMSRSATPATRNEATTRPKPPKMTTSAELPIGTAIRSSRGRLRTVANGCGRLRTVANGCDRERNVERTHPQPPDPQSETGTLATHSGKNLTTNDVKGNKLKSSIQEYYNPANPSYTMLYNAIQCYTMLYNAMQCYAMLYIYMYIYIYYVYIYIMYIYIYYVYIYIMYIYIYYVYIYIYIYVYIYICVYIYVYIRATPGFCPGVAAYICPIHEQMMLQITAIPMGKITQVLETIKQTRSKHPKFLWEKQKRHNTCNSYGKNNKGTSKF